MDRRARGLANGYDPIHLMGQGDLRCHAVEGDEDFTAVVGVGIGSDTAC